jgi:RNA polymerase sigma-70 factor (ECF subfamily)
VSLRAILDRLLSEARARRPELAVTDAQFLAHIKAQLPDGADPAQALAGLHAADLYLACALALGDPRAVALFETELLPEIEKAVAPIDRSRDFVDEVKQILRERLLSGERPRIVDYAGRGPLGAWLRMAATRSALNLRRQAKNRRSAEVRREAEAARVGLDAEVQLLRKRYGRQVKSAIQRAMTRLDGEERRLLKLHYLDGVSLQQIGHDRQVDRSTASRWVAAARVRLLTETRLELERMLRLGPASMDSLLGALGSELDVSLDLLLSRR